MSIKPTDNSVYDKIIDKAVLTAPKPAEYYLNLLYKTVQLGMIESLNTLILESKLQRTEQVKLTALTESIYKKSMIDLSDYKSLSYEEKRDQLKARTTMKLRIATFLHAGSNYDENDIKAEIHQISVNELARLQKKPIEAPHDDYLLLTSGWRKEFIEKYSEEINQIQNATLKKIVKKETPELHENNNKTNMRLS